jgi:hypothetical protein
MRYCKVDGSHDVVQGLFQGIIETRPLSQVVPRTQDVSAVTVNSFLKLNTGELAYVSAINSNGCACAPRHKVNFLKQFYYHVTLFLIKLGYIAKSN